MEQKMNNKQTLNEFLLEYYGELGYEQSFYVKHKEWLIFESDLETVREKLKDKKWRKLTCKKIENRYKYAPELSRTMTAVFCA